MTQADSVLSTPRTDSPSETSFASALEDLKAIQQYLSKMENPCRAISDYADLLLR
jgi:hypothetical protein